MYETTYQHSSGKRHHAIQIPWPRVAEILGHDHEGTPEDDAALVSALRAEGAPAWADDAEGWVDERGWGLIGPLAVVGYEDEEEAREEAARVSAAAAVRQLEDGSYVAIGDASPDRGSPVFHAAGMTYAKDLGDAELYRLGLV